MNRLIIWVLGGALLAPATGFMIANAQQSSAPALIAGDHPVTAEQVREKLQSDGWSNVVVSRRPTRRVQDRVLDQISERIFERVSVCLHFHRLLGATNAMVLCWAIAQGAIVATTED